MTRLLYDTAPDRDALQWRSAVWGTSLHAVVGLFGAARQLLHSILALDDDGESYFALPILVRQLWEYTATAAWIAAEPEERVLRLYQDTNWHVRELAKDGNPQDLDRLVAMWRQMGHSDDSFAKKMPAFEQRLVGFVQDWYPRYRNFSRHIHPSVYVVEHAFVRDGPALTFRTEQPGETPWITFGACMIANLAVVLEIGLSPAGSAPCDLASRSTPVWASVQVSAFEAAFRVSSTAASCLRITQSRKRRWIAHRGAVHLPTQARALVLPPTRVHRVRDATHPVHVEAEKSSRFAAAA